MRSTQERLERLVCAEHCRYYKPWATPEPDCGSLHVLLAIFGKQGLPLDAVERLRDNRILLPLTQDQTLLRRVCRHCELFPDHCAYRRAHRSPNAEPCGGLMVLDRLLSTGQLTPEALPDREVPPEGNGR